MGKILSLYLLLFTCSAQAVCVLWLDVTEQEFVNKLNKLTYLPDTENIFSVDTNKIKSCKDNEVSILVKNKESSCITLEKTHQFMREQDFSKFTVKEFESIIVLTSDKKPFRFLSAFRKSGIPVVWKENDKGDVSIERLVIPSCLSAK